MSRVQLIAAQVILAHTNMAHKRLVKTIAAQMNLANLN